MLFDLLVVINSHVWLRAGFRAVSSWLASSCHRHLRLLPPHLPAAPFPCWKAQTSLTFLLGKAHLAFLGLSARNFLCWMSQCSGNRPEGFCATRKDKAVTAVTAILGYAGDFSWGLQRIKSAAPRLNLLTPAFYFQDQSSAGCRFAVLCLGI